MPVHVAAEQRQGTILALGAASGANFSTEEHDTVAKIGTFLRRQDGTQLAFHFFRVFAAIGQAQSAADADAMGVAHHTAGCAVEIAQ